AGAGEIAHPHGLETGITHQLLSHSHRFHIVTGYWNADELTVAMRLILHHGETHRIEGPDQAGARKIARRGHPRALADGIVSHRPVAIRAGVGAVDDDLVHH